VTTGTVAARVIDATVLVGAGAPREVRCTRAAVVVHEVVARAAVLTRIQSTVVYVRLAYLTCTDKYVVHTTEMWPNTKSTQPSILTG